MATSIQTKASARGVRLSADKGRLTPSLVKDPRFDNNPLL